MANTSLVKVDTQSLVPAFKPTLDPELFAQLNLKSVTFARQATPSGSDQHGVAIKFTGINNVDRFVWDSVNPALKSTAYSLHEQPDSSCYVVQKSVEMILRDVDMRELGIGLNNSALFIDIAINACNGITGLDASMKKLRAEVCNICLESVECADIFSTKSNEILGQLTEVYDRLSQGDTNNVDKYLNDCVTYANEMSDLAVGLSKRFIAAKDHTDEIIEHVTDTYDTKLQAQSDLKKQMELDKGRLDGLQEAVESLKLGVAEAHSLYESYHNAAVKAEKKADTMEYVAMGMEVGKVLVKGATTVATAYLESKRVGLNLTNNAATPKDESDKSATPPATPPATTPKTNEVQPTKSSLQSEVDTLKSEISTIESRLKTYASKKQPFLDELKAIEAAKTDEEKAALKRKDTAAVQKDLDAVTNDESTDQTDLKAKQDALNIKEGKLSAEVFNSASGDLQDAMGKAGEHATKIGEGARETALAKETAALNLLQVEFKLADKKREATIALKELVAALKNSAIEDLNLGMVINALNLANTSLNKVIVVLIMASQFWSQLGLFCKSLRTNKTVDLLMDQSKSTVDQLKEYVLTDAKFGGNYFMLMAFWKAINITTDMYSMAAHSSASLFKNSYAAVSGSQREHWARAIELAEAVEKVLNVQLTTKDQDLSAMKSQLATLDQRVKEQQADLEKSITKAEFSAKTPEEQYEERLEQFIIDGIWKDSWGKWPASLTDYKTTGKWDPALGHLPVWNGAAWGPVPKVAP